jgi:hypothetical protein
MVNLIVIEIFYEDAKVAIAMNPVKTKERHENLELLMH